MADRLNPVDWRRCDWIDAEQHRSRLLTGSLGLEGPWSDWTDGRPEKSAMNREYEYRKRSPTHIAQDLKMNSDAGPTP